MLKKRLLNESGQSIIEFALIFPIFISIMSVVIEFGWIMYKKVTFENMVQTVVSMNIREDDAEAASDLKKYIDLYYAEYSNSSSNLSLTVDTEVVPYDYSEYVYKTNQHKYWKVPMRFENLHTTLEASCDIPFLTPFGKVLFQTEDNTLRLTSRSVADVALSNEPTITEDDEDDDEDDEDEEV